jgi:hypothetical protein
MSFDGEKSERVVKRKRKKVWCSGIICAKPCGVFCSKSSNQLIFSISLQKNEALVVVEPTMNNVELVAHRQVTRIASWCSFGHFHLPTSIIFLPIVGHNARTIMETHGDRLKNQVVSFVLIT